MYRRSDLDPDSVIVMPFNVFNATVWDVVALTGFALLFWLGIAQELKIKRLERRLNKFIRESDVSLHVQDAPNRKNDGTRKKEKANAPNSEP